MLSLIYKFFTLHHTSRNLALSSANIDMIRKAISQFNWNKAFSNTNGNKNVCIFSHTILNILSNFISHEYIMCDDRETHHSSTVR